MLHTKRRITLIVPSVPGAVGLCYRAEGGGGVHSLRAQEKGGTNSATCHNATLHPHSQT